MTFETRRTRRPCGGCADSEEGDLRLAVENLQRKYNELAGIVARYMSEAGIDRPTREANATAMAELVVRIVGGTETSPSEFAECCLIGHRARNGRERWFCTGVLVHPRVVLTAAHCQSAQAPINVVALNATTTTDLTNAEIIDVHRAVVHPLYRPPTVVTNDITVLILRNAAQTPHTPAATTAEIAASNETTLVGFGNNDLHSTKGFGVQRKVTVDITHVRRSPSDNLDDAEQSLGFESDLEFVAGGGGFDSCNGDSGGPSYVDVGGQRRVAGLTSRASEGFTTPCGDGGIYTRVDTQAEFIAQVMRQAGL